MIESVCEIKNNNNKYDISLLWKYNSIAAKNSVNIQ